MEEQKQELKDKKVLFVEDDLFIGEMLIRRLKVAGAECVWAKDGQEGLEELQRDKFDVVITDLMMARMAGEEMIRAIKADSKFKNLPIIVFSNLVTSKRDIEDVEKLGVEGIFIKSNTSLGSFIARIAEILEKK
jgi:DNA-binding response OmpR family regulator